MEKITRIEYADTVLWALLVLQQEERDQACDRFVSFLRMLAISRHPLQEAIDDHRIFLARLDCHEKTMACRAIARRAAIFRC
jgi:hypothetical protein